MTKSIPTHVYDEKKCRSNENLHKSPGKKGSNHFVCLTQKGRTLVEKILHCLKSHDSKARNYRPICLGVQVLVYGCNIPEMTVPVAMVGGRVVVVEVKIVPTSSNTC